MACWPLYGRGQDPVAPQLGLWADTVMPLGAGRAGAARPSTISLLGHQPASKELWLNEMFSCAKASLEMSQGNSGEAGAWPGWSAWWCQEGCWNEAWKGQMLYPTSPCCWSWPDLAPHLPSHSNSPCRAT